MIRAKFQYFQFAGVVAVFMIITIFVIIKFDVDATSVAALIDYGRRLRDGRLQPFKELRPGIQGGKSVLPTTQDNSLINEIDVINDNRDRNAEQRKEQSLTIKDRNRHKHSEVHGSKILQHFIVVTQPRCGSNLLDSYLNQHPLVTSYNELIQPAILLQFNLTVKSSETQLSNYVASMLGNTEPKTGLSGTFIGKQKSRCMISTGFKLHLSQMTKFNLSLLSLLTKLDRPKLILLYRKNLLEQYVSWQIAAETRLWWSTDIQNTVTHKLRLNQFKYFVRTERVLWFNLLTMLRNSQYNRGVDYILISYEDLVSDKKATMNKVFTLLGYRGESRKLFLWLLKQNPMPLNKKISNYDEMAPHLEQFDFTMHLD